VSADTPAGAAFAALESGNFHSASDQFRRLLAGGAADAAIWFGLAVAERHLGAASDEAKALDQALAVDSSYLPALIRRADLYVEQGDGRAACSYYEAAVRCAAALTSLSPQWRREVQRAEAAARRLEKEFESHLLGRLSARGLSEAGTERFGRALDLLLGRRQIYLQQPKAFYFPELPQTQFYDRRQFPWAAALEGATAGIRLELEALLASGRGFEPYIRKAADRPSAGNPLLDSLDWSAGFLIKDGAEVGENATRCPLTMAALRDLPLCRIPGRTPSVLFSLLRPGTRIRPHSGYTNARLICHLPVIVPQDCALRVGNETRAWREAELVVFDDSIEHEAWNLSDRLRVVLLFDIWRPELTDKERSLVAATLEAVGEFGGPKSWAD
jgi:aspartate beta-hydroxylase